MIGKILFSNYRRFSRIGVPVKAVATNFV